MAVRKKRPMLQFAGCVLLSLGLLNVLLSLKSGNTPDFFSYAISTIGAASLLAGLWAARS
jgi:hypothetical protein